MLFDDEVVEVVGRRCVRGGERFADSDRSDDQGVLAGVNEPEAGEFVEEVLVVGAVRGGVPVLEAHPLISPAALALWAAAVALK